MVEVIFHLVVFWKAQQVTVLHVHQVLRLKDTKFRSEKIKHTQTLTLTLSFKSLLISVPTTADVATSRHASRVLLYIQCLCT